MSCSNRVCGKRSMVQHVVIRLTCTAFHRWGWDWGVKSASVPFARASWILVACIGSTQDLSSYVSLCSMMATLPGCCRNPCVRASQYAQAQARSKRLRRRERFDLRGETAVVHGAAMGPSGDCSSHCLIHIPGKGRQSISLRRLSSPAADRVLCFYPHCAATHAALLHQPCFPNMQVWSCTEMICTRFFCASTKVHEGHQDAHV